MKKILSIFILLAAILSSCEDPYANSVYSGSSDVLPAASYMEKTDSLNVNLWVDLLKYTDLFNTMNLQANYTCFVPNNSAIETYLTNKGVSKVTDLNKDDAKLLVRYHTIKGAKYSSVDFSEGLIPDTTATGDYLTSTFLDEGGAIQVNMEGTVTKTIQVTNAYIHIINKVLTPVTETIWDKLQAPEFSIFKQAVVAAGLDSMLNTIIKLEENNLGYIVQRKYRYTLFAVPNDIFNANGVTDLATLVSLLNAGDDYTSPENELNKYVAYHLLNQQISYSDLSAFAVDDKVRSKNLNTMAPNQLINVRDISNTLYINYETTEATGIKLLQLNRNCKNGVMHVVDGLMPIKSPKPTKIQWEMTAYPELAAVIPNYRVASGNTTYIYYLSNGFTCYETLTVPESRQGLIYVLANKNEAVLKKAIYSDYLVISLGMFGWVEMESPAIVSGKYNVYLEHFNPKAVDKQGKLSFILDGNYIGTQISTIGASKTADQFLKTLIGQVEFTETTSHKLRILAGDTFNSYLDCLTFEPITQ
jgi:uncharacterized surface protein with fasciclin (FAS1) repeats